MRAGWTALVVVVFLIAGCGDDDAAVTAGASTTLAAGTTATAPAATTAPTAAPPTTTTVTTTTEAVTTTTAAPAILLGNRGLGIVTFGEAPDPVVAALTAALGDPVADTGWLGPVEGPPGVVCAATERSVRWATDSGDELVATELWLTFNDLFTDGPVFTGYWSYAVPGVDAPVGARGPFPLPSGVTIGSSMAEVKAIHPDFELGGFEELSTGSLDGLKVSFGPDDGRLWTVEAGSTGACDMDEP